MNPSGPDGLRRGRHREAAGHAVALDQALDQPARLGLFDEVAEERSARLVSSAGADRLVSDADGVRAVVVNGTLIREDGRDVVDAEGPLPGVVLRGGSA